MILGEIADKMLPASVYLGIALLIGILAAASISSPRGKWRTIAIGSITGFAGLLAWGLQIDSDLTEAARIELGQDYLTITRYWILGSVAIAIVLVLILRTLCSKKLSP